MPHIMVLLLVVLTAEGVCRLSERFLASGAAAILAAALTILSPAYFVSATHLASDIPAMFFFVWTLVLFIQSVDQRRRGVLILSGLVLGLALWTRYSTASLMPLLLLYGILQGAGLRYAMTTIAVGLAVLSIWFVQNLIVYGNIHPLLVTALPGPTVMSTLLQVPATVSILGGTAGFAPFLAFVAWRRSGRNPVYVLAAGGLTLVSLAMMAFVRGPSYGATNLALLAGFLLVGWLSLLAVARGGVAALALMFRRGLSSLRANRALADEGFLAGWLFLILGSTALALPMANARYLIPIIPALLLLLLRRMENGTVEIAVSRKGMAVGIVASAILSLALAQVDLEAARSFPSFVKEIKDTYASEGRAIYYDGGRGSLDHYMRVFEAGRYLTRDDAGPRPGDIVVRTNLPVPMEIHPSVNDGLHLRKRLSKEGLIPLRLFHHRAGAGFYAHQWGLAPYVISTEPLEWVDVYEVHEVMVSQRELDRPAGEITPQHVVAQTFVSNGRSVTSVKLLLATYARLNSEPLIVKLIATEHGEVLRQKILAPDGIQDNQWKEISFEPVQASPGEVLAIVLESPQATPGNAFTAWQSSQDLYPDGEVQVNGVKTEGDLAFIVLSGNVADP